MSYEVDISPDAADTLSKLPLDVAVFVEEQLLWLAEKPAERSVKIRFPYVLRGQLFHVSYEFHDARYVCDAVFQYSQDETSIHVLYLNVQVVTN